MKETKLKEVQLKLYERLCKADWGEPLKLFILSQDFINILDKLWDESRNGKKFTPVIKQLFRAFEECSYNETKVVIIGQDPYPYLNSADGIAFSCSNKNKTETSLRFIGNEIKRTVYPDQDYIVPNDLICWANQGVLLLNTAFTTQVKKVGKHYELWNPFMTYLLDVLNTNPNLIYVFMGRVASQWNKNINDKNLRFFLNHPAHGAYSKKGWDCQNVFNEINKLLTKKERIKW